MTKEQDEQLTPVCLCLSSQHPSICLSGCLTVYLSICLSVYLSTSPHFSPLSVHHQPSTSNLSDPCDNKQAPAWAASTSSICKLPGLRSHRRAAAAAGPRAVGAGGCQLFLHRPRGQAVGPCTDHARQTKKQLRSRLRSTHHIMNCQTDEFQKPNKTHANVFRHAMHRRTL